MLNIQADLDLEHRGFVYRLKSRPDGGLEFVLPSLTAAVLLLSTEGLQGLLSGSERWLRHWGQTVQVTLKGRVLAELGRDSWSVQALSKILR